MATFKEEIYWEQYRKEQKNKQANNNSNRKKLQTWKLYSWLKRKNERSIVQKVQDKACLTVLHDKMMGRLKIVGKKKNLTKHKDFFILPFHHFHWVVIERIVGSLFLAFFLQVNKITFMKDLFNKRYPLSKHPSSIYFLLSIHSFHTHTHSFKTNHY